MTALHRYTIMGISDYPSGPGEQQWLKYPVTHGTLESVQFEVDRLNAEVAEAEESGEVHPFVRYEAVPVDDGLIGRWDERLRELAR